MLSTLVSFKGCSSFFWIGRVDGGCVVLFFFLFLGGATGAGSKGSLDDIVVTLEEFWILFALVLAITSGSWSFGISSVLFWFKFFGCWLFSVLSSPGSDGHFNVLVEPPISATESFWTFWTAANKTTEHQLRKIFWWKKIKQQIRNILKRKIGKIHITKTVSKLKEKLTYQLNMK